MCRYAVLFVAACLLVVTSTAEAQWFDLTDPDTGTVCGLVNAENVQLVISEPDSNLMLVNGTDRVLANTVVTSETEVLIDGEVVGFIEYATDQAGRRRVFWITNIGSLYSLSAEGEPIATEIFPEEVTGQCDPCEALWDNPDDCVPLDDGDTGSSGSPSLASLLCGAGAGTGLAMAMMFGLAIFRFAGLRP